jgi:hypothetical protein
MVWHYLFLLDEYSGGDEMEENRVLTPKEKKMIIIREYRETMLIL